MNRRTARWLLLFVLSALWALPLSFSYPATTATVQADTLPPPIPPKPPRPPKKKKEIQRRGYVLGESLFIEPQPPAAVPGYRNQKGTAFALAGEITVAEDEEATGDVVVLFGSIEVFGRVHGNVVSVMGNVHLGPRAVVDGDVVAANLAVEPGAQIHGDRVEIPFPNMGFPFGRDFFRHGGGLLLAVILLTISSLFGILTLAVAPRQVAKVNQKIDSGLFKSFFVGFVGEILLLPIFILLCVTVIGIPVAFLIFPLLVVAAYLLGNTAISLSVGQKLRQGTQSPGASSMITMLSGKFFLYLPFLCAGFLGLFGGGFGPLFRTFSLIFFLFGLALHFAATASGFGAALLSRYGTRPKEPPPPPPAAHMQPT